MSEKSQLRRKILNQRKALSHREWQEKSQQICDRITSFAIFREAKTVLAYFSFDKEPDISYLLNKDKEYGFPICQGKNLSWRSWQQEAALNRGKYGIKEPLATAPQITSQAVDLIIVPTVACDTLGYRLGYGGGYYDRLFSLNEWQNIPRLGVVFDFAYLDRLPVEPWDVKLNYICTELSLQEY